MSNYPKYLYGASVQGIQDFIFQTNKLKEIVGASELVAQICTTAFDEFAEFKETKETGESIVRAAGNIKYIFSTESACQKAVLEFPKKVMTMAPGITISQAVVILENEDCYSIKANELEQKLIIQRNKPSNSITTGLIGISRAPSTGLPAVGVDREGALIDEASECKQKNNTKYGLAKKSFGSDVSTEQIAYDIEKITDRNNWIAIIHADGNGIGNIIRTVGANKDDMKAFSGALENITTTAANQAFSSVWNLSDNEGKMIPMRPVVLSGDDMTIICRADLAIAYTQKFLEVFEAESKSELKKIKLKKTENQSLLEDGLTACAGVAFIKSSYPFHYGASLAESLCSRAKKASKKIDSALAPSCLMFHKVQDSFVEDFEKIAQRELRPAGTKLNFEAGPYYCGKRAAERFTDACSSTISNLLENIEKADASSTQLRNWIGTLYTNIEAANQLMKRMRIVNRNAELFIDKQYESLSFDEETIIPFYDMLSLASILQIQTKSKQK